MFDYLTFTSNLIQETRAREKPLPLIEGTSGSRFFLHPGETDKICLFFHGFTAVPEQFVPIGEAFFQAGCNVLIPLLPGHGIAGNWDSDNPPPLPEDKEVYQQFALEWLQIAQALGKKIIVSGLSGGSTLAAWLALERAVQVYRGLIFAPYLSGSNIFVDLIVKVLDFYFQWRTEPGVKSFGYDGFSMPSLRLFLDMGEEIIKKAESRYTAPMLIVSSENDRAVGSHEHKELFEAVLKNQPKSWYYCFDRDLGIPHNMMTEGEGNKHLDLLIAIAKDYVESDLTWWEARENLLKNS